ncbi:MAG: hypothetical protein ACOZAR_02505 [Patescibacteria group bacterium]
MTRVIFLFFVLTYLGFSLIGCGGGSGTGADVNVNTPVPLATATPLNQLTTTISGIFLMRDKTTPQNDPNMVVLIQSSSINSSAIQTNYNVLVHINNLGKFTSAGAPYGTLFFYGWPSSVAYNNDAQKNQFVCSSKFEATGPELAVVLVEGEFIQGNPTPVSTPTANPIMTPTPTGTTTPPTTTPTTVPTTLPTPNGAQVVVSGLPIGAVIEVLPKIDISGYNWVEFSPADKVSGDDHRYRLNFTAPSPLISGTAGNSGVVNINGLTVGNYYNVRVMDSSGKIIGNFYFQTVAGNNSFTYPSGNKRTVRFYINQKTNTTTERLVDLSKCTVYLQMNNGSAWYSECYWQDYSDTKGYYVDFQGMGTGAGTVNFWLVDKFGNNIGSNTVYVNIGSSTSKVTIPMTDFQPMGDQFMEDPNGVDHFGNGSAVSGGWNWPVTAVSSDKYFWQKTSGYTFSTSRLVAVKIKCSPLSRNQTETLIFRSDITGAAGVWYYRGVREKDFYAGNDYVIIIFPAEAGTNYKISQLATSGYLGGVTINWVSIFQIMTVVAGNPEYQ